MAASSNLVFDFTVVGAGVEGSATAYQLSKMVPGKRIALVEQVCSARSGLSSNWKVLAWSIDTLYFATGCEV